MQLHSVNRLCPVHGLNCGIPLVHNQCPRSFEGRQEGFSEVGIVNHFCKHLYTAWQR